MRFIVVLCLVLMPLLAQAQDTFLVENIQVDASGTSASEARDKAIQQATLQGFETLSSRVAGAPITLPYERVATMVQEMQVASERFSSEHYTATFSLRFAPDMVRAALGDRGLAIQDTMPDAPKEKHTLVLPVFTKNNSSLLMESRNPWRMAWDTTKPGSVALPVGDLEDLTLVTPVTALKGNYADMTPLAKKYYATDIIVAHAYYSQPTVLTVTLRYVEPKGVTIRTGDILVIPNEPEQTLLERAARQISAIWSKEAQQKASYTNAPRQQFLARVHFNDLRQWSAIRSRLPQVTGLQDLDIIAIMPKYVDIAFSAPGSADEVTARLQEHGLMLRHTEQGYIISE